MNDFEKVINGLQCCSQNNAKCGKCMYASEYPCVAIMARDALELLNKMRMSH